MKRKNLFPLLASAPLLYTAAALLTRSVETKMALQFALLALIAGASSAVGPMIASRVRFFRGSQFWATETGLLIVLFGFLAPLFSLAPESELSTALSEHLLLPALLSVSCLAGVGAIVDDRMRRPERSRVRR